MVKLKQIVLLPALLGSLSLTLGACGGGGGAGNISGGAGAAVGLTVQDAPVDTFSKVAITLSSVKLLDANGVATANLLTAPRSFEFLGLSVKQALLALAPSVPPGTYTDLSMTATAVTALDLSGSPVTTTLRTGQGQADLLALGGSALTFDGSSFSSCAIDVDLNRSFTADPANLGQFLFDLTFNASSAIAPTLDQFRATVTAIDSPGRRFTGRLIDDRVAGSAFGSMDIVVADGDFLAHDDGHSNGTATASLNELEIGKVVQVDGDLQPNGVFNARRVVMEDDSVNGASTVEIEGEVRSLDTVAKTFTLLVKETRRGSSIADPVLSGLADPNLITVSYDANTLVMADDANSSGLGLVETALVPGMEVDARFLAFAGPEPFLTSSIEVGDGRPENESGIEYEGVLTDVGGLPSTFSFTMDNAEPAVTSGLVSAPVSVSLSTAPTLFLDAGPQPTLHASDLVVNLRMKINGAVSGPANGASLAPTRVKVKAGELKGTLTAVDLGASTVSVTIDSVERSFGGVSDPNGSVVITVDPTAQIETDAGGSALVDLAGLLGGSPVIIKLEGLADGSGALTAWSIEQDE